MPYIGNQHNVGDHVNNFKVLDDISSYTATFDGSATSVVSTSAETIRIPEHRFIQGQRVTYNNGGGSNIGGLTSGTAYYISFDSANTVKLATSLANANSNTVINLSSVGSGTSHTLNAAFDGVNTKFKLTFGSGNPARLNNATQINVAINNVIQRPNLDANNFADGFALADNHKIVFKTAPTSQDIFWGSIIANTIENFDLRDNEVDNFTGNGSTTEFTLSTIPSNNESVIVTIDGVLQHPSDKDTERAYTLIDSILKFTAAPALNAEIQARHIGFAGATTGDVSGFYGRTGNVVLGSSDHITTGDITSRNINASGILTASSASFGGNVSIGGTLTYEDITNIDSVGVITARAGIDCNADLDVDGHTNLDNLSVAGVSTFSGIVAAGVGSTAITLSNSHKMTFGSAHELEMFHDGSNSYIKNRFNGYPSVLNIISENSGINIMSGSGSNAHGGYENAIRCNNNGSVELYWSGAKHLETYGAGVMIQGNLQVGQDIAHHGDTDTKIKFPAHNTISFETTGSERLRITSGGEILIGTTTDANIKLDVEGPIRAKAAGYVAPTSGTGLEIYYATNTLNDAPSGYLISYDRSSSAYKKINYDASEHKLRTSGTERLRITSDGKVGINTDNPEKKVTIWADNGVTNTDIFQIRSKTGAFNIRVSDSDASNPEWAIRTYSSEPIVFMQATTERARIASDGRLGIGIAAPTKLLDIATSTSTDGIRVKSTGNTYNEIAFDANRTSATNHIGRIVSRWNGTLVSYISFDTGTDTTNKDDGQIRFFTSESGGSNLERLRITSGGDMGLGTSSPNSYSNQRVFTINGTSYGRLDLEVGGTLKGSVWADNGGLALDAGGNDIEMYTGSAMRVKINTSGQMGIGQNFTPSRHLDIKDSTGANRIVNIRGTGTSGAFLAFLDANTTDDSKCRIGSIGGNNIGIRGDAHHFQNGGGTDRMVINSSGVSTFYNDVTIDTTALASSASLTIRGGEGSQAYLYMIADDGDDGGDNWRIGAMSGFSNRLIFYNSASGSYTDVVSFQTDGTIRPGTTNSANLGTDSYRWANVYTNDLQLSNKGKTNDVDGTWGDYTIQEGESDLFLINNRNGKKYKFNLTEVS